MTFKTGSSSFTALKICGVTQPNQAKAIASIGANALGVIGVEKSKRFVEEGKRRKIFSELQLLFPIVERVWVTADMTDIELTNGLQGDGSPSIVQLHGSESPDRCEALRKKHPNIQWWKAIRIRDPRDLEKAKYYSPHVDALLLDSWSKSALGGTGNKIPLEWLVTVDFSIPWWLAGGISAEWIPSILNRVQPFGIDASSQVESSPGVKDLQKVEELIQAIKNNINLKDK